MPNLGLSDLSGILDIKLPGFLHASASPSKRSWFPKPVDTVSISNKGRTSSQAPKTLTQSALKQFQGLQWQLSNRMPKIPDQISSLPSNLPWNINKAVGSAYKAMEKQVYSAANSCQQTVASAKSWWQGFSGFQKPLVKQAEAPLISKSSPNPSPFSLPSLPEPPSKPFSATQQELEKTQDLDNQDMDNLLNVVKDGIKQWSPESSHLARRKPSAQDVKPSALRITKKDANELQVAQKTGQGESAITSSESGDSQIVHEVSNAIDDHLNWAQTTPFNNVSRKPVRSDSIPRKPVGIQDEKDSDPLFAFLFDQTKQGAPKSLDDTHNSLLDADLFDHLHYRNRPE